jgi:acyl carrier protein
MEKKFLDAVKEIMDIDDKEPGFQDKFRDFENWDSLKELSMLAMMDSEFGIELEMKDFNKFITLGDIFEYIKENGNR